MKPVTAAKSIRKQEHKKLIYEKYSKNVLGYKLDRDGKSKLVCLKKRLNILYDHLIHHKSIRELIREHSVNYSTLRHILAQYYLFGRIEGRKFKSTKNNINLNLNDAKSQKYVSNSSLANVPMIKHKKTDGSRVTLEFESTS